MTNDDYNNKSVVSEQYFIQVSESVKSIFELSTRMDERIQSLTKTKDEHVTKLDNQLSLINALNAKILVLESKEVNNDCEDDLHEIGEKVQRIELAIEDLKGKATRSEGRWKAIFSFVVQLLWIVLATYILVKLGLSKP